MVSYRRGATHVIVIHEEDWEILNSYKLWRAKEINEPLSMAEAVHHLMVQLARSEVSRMKKERTR